MKRSICTLLSAWLLSGCGDTPSDQEPSDAADQPEDAEVEESALIQVPRNRTLIMDCAESGTCAGQIKDYNTFNPYRPESTSRTGYNFVFEPLYFYNAFKGRLIPWIATDHRFNDAYTEVEITIRPGVQWSDGMPWTAHDLVFTINMLKDNAPLLSYSTDMKNWVQEAVAVDSLTARIALTAPNPRFVFSYFTHNFGNGVPIVPKHVWEGQSPDTFENFDPQKGWPVFSGPYKLVLSTPQQRIWDLRPDWWAAATGFQSLPKVERIIYLPYMEEAKRVQNLITNHIDTSLDLRPPNILTVLDKNPRVTTWTGRAPPYGYVDFWPISLGFNNLEAPFADVNVRRAINYAINRQQLVEVGWQGAGISTLLPLPDYPALRPYFSEVEDLFEEYEIGVFDLDKSAALMRSMGWQRSADGYWTKDGAPFEMLIDIFPIFQDITPVLVAQLERAGFDADFRNTPDTFTRISHGTARSFITGHAGGVRDPYFTLRLYHSRFVHPTGQPAESVWRWQNEEFDRIVDQMAEVSPRDPQLVQLYRQAMEIWLAELPSIPLLQWYHRIPHNQTYWRNWPSEYNPYINSAYWHRVWLLVLLNLQPVQG